MTTSEQLVTLFFPVILFAASGYGQDINRRNELKIEELAESLAASPEESTDGSLLIEDLSYYTTHPVYINKASEEELVRLNLLNFKQVRTILTYREKYGRILTLYELLATGDFSEDLLQKLASLVRFDEERDSLQVQKDHQFRQSLLVRMKGSLPVAEGYHAVDGKAPAYCGNPCGYYTRYRGEVGKWLEFGLTAESDAGEDFFRNSNRYGFDFLSGFICWHGKGLIRKIIAGDYHLRFGQGVNLWSGGGVSYASDLCSVMRTGEGIRPCSSTDENLFFRGVALQLKIKSAQLSLYYSDKLRDANLVADSLGQHSITSFRLDGLHRTSIEAADKHDVNERMCGIYSDFRFEKWRFGLLANCLKFGLPVTNGQEAYKSKTFEGNVNLNFGVDYHVILKQISLFGEAGMSQNLRPATVHGIIWRPHQQYSLSLLYRYYDPSFQSFYSGAFSEGSGTRNEEGLFAAFEFYPVAKVKITGQADLYYFPWMTYQTISPDRGHALAFQAEMTVRPDLMIYLHARLMCQPQKMTATNGVPGQWDEFTSKWRLHADWRLSEKLQSRSRVEFVDYQFDQKKENGWLAFQDFIYSASFRFKSWLRLAYYHTDGFDSRVYSYENDLLYCYSIPEFYGVGIRSYLYLKWQPLKKMIVELKAGYTLRAGAPSLGSGNDATPGNTRFDFRGQISLNL